MHGFIKILFSLKNIAIINSKGTPRVDCDEKSLLHVGSNILCPFNTKWKFQVNLCLIRVWTGLVVKQILYNKNFYNNNGN